MGNKIEVGEAKNSNIVGGNVTGGVNLGHSSGSDDGGESSQAVKDDMVKRLESNTSKTGLILITIFVLSLIVLFVITR